MTYQAVWERQMAQMKALIKPIDDHINWQSNRDNQSHIVKWPD